MFIDEIALINKELKELLPLNNKEDNYLQNRNRVIELRRRKAELLEPERQKRIIALYLELIG